MRYIIFKLLVIYFSSLLFLKNAVFASDTPSLTLKVSNCKLKQIFRAIEDKSGYYFTYSKSTVDIEEVFTLDVVEMKLTSLLDLLLVNKTVNWTIRGKAIVLSKKDFRLPVDSIPRRVKYFQISGRVVTISGEPVQGATVMLKGTKNISVTDSHGNYSMGNILDNSSIVISYVGYETRTVQVDRSELSPIVLKERITELKNVDVISTGYQELTRNRVTGSVFKIDNEQFNRQPDRSILNRIQNITSGLIVNHTSRGRSGDLNVRGKISFESSPRPLIVVDNFPYEGSLDALNPSDVESITVLKDAAAAAIWGARAGNGVIVVSTKRGRYNRTMSVQGMANVTISAKPDLNYLQWSSGATMVEFEKYRFQQGFYSAYDSQYPSLGIFTVAPQSIEILLKAKRDGIQDPLNDAGVLESLNGLSNFDIRDDISKKLVRNAITQQYNLSLNGGSERINYFTSIGYMNVITDEVKSKNDVFNLSMATNFKLTPKLEMGVLINHSRSNTHIPGTSYSALLSNRELSPYTRLNGTNGENLSIPYKYRTAYVDTATYPQLLDWTYSPISELSDRSIDGINQDTRISANIKYEVLSWLKAEVQAQQQYSNSQTKDYSSINSFQVRDGINSTMNIDPMGRVIYPWPKGGLLNKANFNSIAWNVRGALTVDKMFNQHRVNIIVGVEGRQSKNEGMSLSMYGYDPNTYTYQAVNPLESISIRPRGSLTIGGVRNPTGTLDRFGSAFMNSIYSFDNRYNFSLSGRIDESNYYGLKSNLRRVPLWSSGIGWTISEEGFYKMKWLPVLKARISYGFTGNTYSASTSFATFRYMNSDFSVPNRGVSFGEILSPNNPNLKWEKVKIINAGVDFSAFKDRLSGSFEYYIKDGIDLIGPVLTDPTSGFTNYNGNQSSISSKGWELILNSLVYTNHTFSWRNKLLISYNTNKVRKYTGLVEVTPLSLMTGATYVEGNSLQAIYSYKWGGLNPVDGSPRLIAMDTTTAFNEIGNIGMRDINYHGTYVPKYFGTFLNELRWKDITLSLNIIYRFKYFFRRNSIRYRDILTNSWIAHKDFERRWIKKGDESFTDVPALPSRANTARDDAYTYSDLLISKGDHIRLQDIKLNYTFKNVFGSTSKSGLNVEAYFFVSNIGIIWKANKEGIDPDYYFSNTIPQPKRFTFGINANF